MNPHIVVAGGGFAGTTLVRALQRRLPPGATLTLISEESYTTFNPMLPEAVGAALFPEHAVAPIRAMLEPRARFIMGTVTHIHTRERTLTCDTLAGARTLAYDHLVLALGSRARLDLVPGAAEHALPLKTVGDAMHIRNMVLRRAARIELESDPGLRASLGRFVVIGGGFSGVETAGMLADCLAGLARYYPRISKGELEVVLLHDREALLPELPASLGRAAARSLARRGVVLKLATRAVEITQEGVRLAGGSFVAAGTVILTIGTRPNAVLQDIHPAKGNGRIAVAPDLSVPGHEGLWALGDCALVPNAHDGTFSPPTAQFAVRQAKHLARNLLAKISNRNTEAFRHRSLGMMATVGHLKGVAQVFGLPLSGLPAWLLWRAYYLSQMPTLGRKVRIFVEWTWGMFFPADITHLRFTRSRDAAQPVSDMPEPRPTRRSTQSNLSEKELTT